MSVIFFWRPKENPSPREEEFLGDFKIPPARKFENDDDEPEPADEEPPQKPRPKLEVAAEILQRQRAQMCRRSNLRAANCIESAKNSKSPCACCWVYNIQGLTKLNDAPPEEDFPPADYFIDEALPFDPDDMPF